MKRNNHRDRSGQSMAEYALGLGCIAALCMVVLGSLGHELGDIIFAVERAIIYGGARPSEPGRIVRVDATPWVIN